MNKLTVSILFIICCVIKGLNGQNAICRTAGGERGQCISLYSCPELLAAAERMLPQDIYLLRRSNCGRVEGIPAVCCPQQKPKPPPPTPPRPPAPPPTPPPPPPPRKPPPPRQPPPPPTRLQNNQCTTPDYKTGQCINIYSCPALLDLLTESSSEQNIQYVQNLRCNGPDANSVCCPPSAPITVKPRNPCASTVSAIPPDSSSGCCGADSGVSNKIFGGQNASIDQFPWLVLIEYTKLGKTKTSCGGSLISGRYVLTAAHCLVGDIFNKIGRPTMVRLGEYDKSHDGPDCMPIEAGGEDCTEDVLRIPIEKTIAHPDYNPRRGPRWHDIGLIRLTRLAPYTDFIRPVCLPKRDITRTIKASQNLTVAGWGAVSDKEISSDIKLYVDLPYVPLDRCQPSYNTLKTREPLSRNQICAGGVKGEDSCKGDSGGPLMYEMSGRQEVVGIVSFGHKVCGSENIPAVYTHVYQYDSWIRSNISP